MVTPAMPNPIIQGCIVLLLVVAEAVVMGAAGANTPSKSGITPSAISLPSGPGSIEGLGESFEPQLNMGNGHYSWAHQ